MKRALLFSIFFFFSTIAVLAYETVIIKYPPGDLWVKAYYKKVGNEAILQYVPKNETSANWNRTIIVHSYFESYYPVNVFITNQLIGMKKNNPTGNYRYLKSTPNDSMAFRCTEDYKEIKAQCEFYRVSHAHDGIISLHYINRDKEDFMANYKEWYEIIKRAKYYNSYYRDERILDKAEFFELW
jgi:hypothetical protein